MWDRYEMEDTTLQEFIDYFKDKHNLAVSMVSSGVSSEFYMYSCDVNEQC